MAAAVSLAPVGEGLPSAAGALKESGRDAGERSRTSIRLTYPGECWKVN